MTHEDSTITTILIVDDHQIFRSGLRDALSVDPAIECVGECSATHEVLPAVDHLHPDVVLMDVMLLRKDNIDLTGIGLTRQIKDQWPATEIIMLSTFEQLEVVRESIYAGASGYLSKHADGRAIVSAIREVLNGNIFIDPSIKGWRDILFPRKNLSQTKTNIETPPKYLIPVMNLMAQGLLNEEIYRRLKLERGNAHLERKTVRNYVSDIKKWLGAIDRQSANEELRLRGYGKYSSVGFE